MELIFDEGLDDGGITGCGQEGVAAGEIVKGDATRPACAQSREGCRQRLFSRIGRGLHGRVEHAGFESLFGSNSAGQGWLTSLQDNVD